MKKRYQIFQLSGGHLIPHDKFKNTYYNDELEAEIYIRKFMETDKEKEFAVIPVYRCFYGENPDGTKNK
jgi:hypothetical protein